MKPVQPPCYDTSKRKDCPNRSADCHITCKKWREYEKQRDAEYDRRKLEKSALPVNSKRKEAAIRRKMKRY